MCAKKNEQNKNIETISRDEHFSAEGYFGNNTSCFHGMGEHPLDKKPFFPKTSSVKKTVLTPD